MKEIIFELNDISKYEYGAEYFRKILQELVVTALTDNVIEH